MLEKLSKYTLLTCSMKYVAQLDFWISLFHVFFFRKHRVRSSMSNTRDSVSSGYPNPEKRVKNTTHRRGTTVSLKSMLIKTGRSNLLHGCDFLSFTDVMSY